jgi:hypothetical protein
VYDFLNEIVMMIFGTEADWIDGRRCQEFD